MNSRGYSWKVSEVGNGYAELFHDGTDSLDLLVGTGINKNSRHICSQVVSYWVVSRDFLLTSAGRTLEDWKGE